MLHSNYALAVDRRMRLEEQIARRNAERKRQQESLAAQGFSEYRDSMDSSASSRDSIASEKAQAVEQAKKSQHSKFSLNRLKAIIDPDDSAKPVGSGRQGFIRR